MSGLVGHTAYAVLTQETLRQRRPRLAELLRKHWHTYLSAAYIGCDIQTLPEAICVDTGEEVGYGTIPLERSPLTGGLLRPWSLQFADSRFTPRQIHTLFYGRSHLVFGWSTEQQQHLVPWDHLPDFAAAALQDVFEHFSGSESAVAWICGWLVHIVGDSLIKSVRPGLQMTLLDGLYTPRNRPVQDLYTFHEVGIGEFGLNWPELFAGMSRAAQEPVQYHVLRCARPRGNLAAQFSNAWEPAQEQLLEAVCRENRRYLGIYAERLLKSYALRTIDGEQQCAQELSAAAGGLTWAEMRSAAQQARFREVLSTIAAEAATMVERSLEGTPATRGLR
ncbi:MAG: hypothetical protein RLZZ436_3575 [Planctomycetota bacterium]|jgi:hypothetical protein